MKRMVTSGTARTISMKAVLRMRTTGRPLRRPMARATPSGNDSAMLTTARRSVSNSPPQTLLATLGSTARLAKATQ